MKETFEELGRRSNILYKRTSSKDVLIYEDHRTILNILFAIQAGSFANEPIDLIMFDKHDDFLDPSDNTVEKLIEFLSSPTQEGLNNIVEFDLRGNDDDWVKAGMELGLIGNCFLFNSTKGAKGFRHAYETQKFGIRYLYNIGNVWDALDGRGILNDMSADEFKALWSALGYEKRDGNYELSQGRNFVFDIDLDCFSIEIMDDIVAIPEDIIFHKFHRNLNLNLPSHNYSSAKHFVDALIERSRFFTICYESQHCGGIRQAHKIFNTVDELFFDNELGGHM